MLSTSSSPDDICACGHLHMNHTASRCVSCEMEARPTIEFMHGFTRPAEPIVDVELPEPEAPKYLCVCSCPCPTSCGCCPDETEIDQMMTDGEPVQLVSPDDRCTCGHKRKKHTTHYCRTCYRENGTIEVVYHAFELATDPVEEDPSPYGCPSCDGQQAAFEAGSHQGSWPAPVMPRRPPYAVAYAVQDGHVYEIALPGDATVIAEDGVLKISHPGAVLALVQARPMEVADADQVPPAPAG